MEKLNRPAFMWDYKVSMGQENKESADVRYEKMMKHYSSRYGKEKGYKKAREKIAFAIAHEVFTEHPDSPILPSYYYYAARDALSEGSRELAAELVDKAERTFSAWKERYRIGNTQGYFIGEGIREMKELLRG